MVTRSEAAPDDPAWGHGKATGRMAPLAQFVPSRHHAEGGLLMRRRTSDPGERNIKPVVVLRAAWSAGPVPYWKQARHVFSRLALPVALALLGGLVTGCISGGAHIRGCASRSEILPASQASSLVAVDPRTSRESASWGLHELAQLLPLRARSGLDVHVFYTEDSDDLVEGGGDGGPAQVLQTQAPGFSSFRVPGAPDTPADPTALTAKLYCEHLTAWENHAMQVLRAEAARRDAAVRAWARTVVARLLALAGMPIPDTTGAEAGVEFDAGASVFAAAQVASAAPRPAVVFLGGLTALAPPSQSFRFPAHLVAVVRSTNPAQVLPAERVWSRWATRNGGIFKAISANDAPVVIAGALDG